jgi:hypothetical protein
MHRMIARETVNNQLFEPGGYEYNIRNRGEVEKAIGRAWKRLEDGGLIEEPDFTNGKNGFRIPSEKGKALAATIDFGATRARGRFTREAESGAGRVARRSPRAVPAVVPGEPERIYFRSVFPHPKRARERCAGAVLPTVRCRIRSTM